MVGPEVGHPVERFRDGLIEDRGRAMGVGTTNATGKTQFVTLFLFGIPN